MAQDSVSVLLTWTAPSDYPGAQACASYLVHFSLSESAEWNETSPYAALGNPSAPGSPESLLVESLLPATPYYFQLRSGDAAMNVSSPSNQATATTKPGIDRTPPGMIVDLHADVMSPTVVRLQWTAPGDDGQVGTATAYDIRFSTSPLDDVSFLSAHLVPNALSPAPAGSGEVLDATGLTSGIPYYLAVRSSDDWGLWSPMSNVATITMPDGDEHWWTGFACPPMGQGIEHGVRALVVHQGMLVAGGASFGSEGTVAAWDGRSWQSLGDFSPGRVLCLCEFEGHLVAGGVFAKGGISIWDGASWDSFGMIQNGGSVYAMAVFRNELIVAGQFNQIGGVPAHNIASWNGTTWTALGDGISETESPGGVFALETYQANLIAAGAFRRAGSLSTGSIASWNGTEWGRVSDGGFSNDPYYAEITDLVAYGPDLVAVGTFSAVDGKPIESVARWDGLAWHAVGSGIGGHGWAAAAVYHGDLIVAKQLAGPFRWKGYTWETMGTGLQGNYTTVSAIAVQGNALFFGGEIRRAGSSPSCGIARWDD